MKLQSRSAGTEKNPKTYSSPSRRLVLGKRNPFEKNQQVVHYRSETEEANSHCVSNSNTVHANLVDGTVDREKIDEVGTERVLAGESDLETLGLDELDNLDRSLFLRVNTESDIGQRLLKPLSRLCNKDHNSR